MPTDHDHNEYCGPDSGPGGCPGPVTYDELKAAGQKPTIEQKVAEMDENEEARRALSARDRMREIEAEVAAERTPHERGCSVAEPCSECRPVAILPVDLQHEQDRPRSLRQILWTHRALAGAGPDEITDLMRQINRWAEGQHQAVAGE